MSTIDDTLDELIELCKEVINPEGKYLFFVDWVEKKDGEEITHQVGVRVTKPPYTLNVGDNWDYVMEEYGPRSNYRLLPEGIILPTELAFNCSVERQKTLTLFVPPKDMFVSYPTAFDGDGPDLSAHTEEE